MAEGEARLGDIRRKTQPQGIYNCCIHTCGVISVPGIWKVIPITVLVPLILNSHFISPVCTSLQQSICSVWS